jgi:hypothetical protein
MNTINIKAPTNAKYVADIPELNGDLPDNCLFNKNLVGAGATTIAITNNLPYVIAVPFISLADNKQAQHDNILSVHSGIKDIEIRNYLKSGGNKFIVVYDSLARLETFIDVSKYKLLVDECHKIIEWSASFKPAVIHHLLTTFTNYNSYVFMSATPIRNEFLPDQLMSLPIYNIEWSSVNKVILTHQRIHTQFESYVTNVCLSHIRKEKEGNAYLFYNSVKAIIKTIKQLQKLSDITHEDIKIICANNTDNLKLIQTCLGNEFTIGKAHNPEDTRKRKINFVTSCAFEGSDIYDTDGVTYIISDGHKVHAKLDISTQVSQIVGRIRDSIYNSEVFMLWCVSPIDKCVSLDTYKENLKAREEEAHKMLEDFTNARAERTKVAIRSDTQTDPYFIDMSTDTEIKVIFNTVATKALLNNYVGLTQTYNVHKNKEGCGVVATLRDIFTGAEADNDWFSPLSGADKLKLGNKPLYKDVCLDYAEALLNKDKDVIDTIESDPDYQELVEFVSIYGVDKLSSVSYQKSKIVAEINKYSSTNTINTKELPFKVDGVYTKADIKIQIQNYYNSKGIKAKAKATDITKWYDTKLTKLNNKDAYKILNTK